MWVIMWHKTHHIEEKMFLRFRLSVPVPVLSSYIAPFVGTGKGTF